jgi:hypothetical protein
LATRTASALNIGQGLLGQGHGLSCTWGGRVTELYVTDSSLFGAVMKKYAPLSSGMLVNTAHIPKLNNDFSHAL